MELSNVTLLSGETFDENVLGAVVLRQNGDIPFQSALLQDFDMVVLVLHEEQDREHIVRHTTFMTNGPSQSISAFLLWSRLLWQGIITNFLSV